MVWILIRFKNEDIRTMSTSSVSPVDFEQVNICWDVTKCLLNDFWSILNMLSIRCYPLPSNIYWHNVLIYNSFWNKNAGDTFTYYMLEKFNQQWNKVVQVIWDKSKKKGKSKTIYIYKVKNEVFM